MKCSVLYVLMSILLVSCTKNPTGLEISETITPVAKGVYILHEGNYGDPSGARLALYDLTVDTVFTDVVEGANQGAHLGSTGDDMLLFRDRIYVLMSGSENIVVLSRNDHRVVQSAYFPGWVPHAMVIDSLRNRIYVTRLYKSSVMALDLTTLAVLDSAVVGANPQELVLAGDELFVCNSGYGSENTVSVLAVAPLQTRATVRVGAGPTGITQAGDGTLWVACTGNPYGTPAVPGSIYSINPITRVVKDSVLFSGPLWGSMCVGADGAGYFLGVSPGSYYGGPVHRIHLNTLVVTTMVVPGTFYALGVDRGSGDMYLADAKSFTTQGEVRSLTSTLAHKRTVPVQRGPAVFAFTR